VTAYTARCTLFERRQAVHIFIRLGVPFSITRIFFMFGFHIFLARRDTWLRVMLILCPVWIDFSHI